MRAFLLRALLLITLLLHLLLPLLLVPLLLLLLLPLLLLALLLLLLLPLLLVPLLLLLLLPLLLLLLLIGLPHDLMRNGNQSQTKQEHGSISGPSNERSSDRENSVLMSHTLCHSDRLGFRRCGFGKSFKNTMRKEAAAAVGSITI